MRTLQMERERNTPFLSPATFVVSTSRHRHFIHDATQVLCLHKDVTHPSALHNLFTHHVTIRDAWRRTRSMELRNNL